MFCERCGNPVGDSEKFCSQCGAPIPEAEATAAAESVSVEAEAAAAAESVSVEAEAAAATESVSVEAEAAAAAESVSVEAEATAAAESVSVEAEAAAAAESVSVEAEAAAAAESVSVEAAIPTPLSVPQVQEAPIAPAIPADKPDVGGKKPKKKKAPWIIAACAVAAVVVICAVNGAWLGNFFRRTFSSPAKYYQYVEENTVSALVRTGSTYYETLFMDSLSMKGRSTDLEFAVELGEGGQELIELLEMADVDLTWLTDFSLGVGYSLKDYLLGYDISFGLNKTDILSLRTITDMEGGAMYFQVPELTADYIGVGLDEFTDGYGMESFEAYKEMQETLAAVQKAMPDAKDVEKLLQRYLKLALNNVSDVEKSTRTLKVDGVQQKCTELEVTFDGKSLSKMLEAILRQIPKDKDLKKLFVGIVDNLMAIDGVYPAIDGEDAWDEFTEDVEDLLDSLDELEDMDEVLVMKVYVDGKGKIVGRVLELVEDRETYATISFLALEKGSRFGYEFSVQPGSGYDMGAVLTGSGKKSGNKLTGDFKLKYGGISVLDMKVSDLDMRQLEKGYLNGSIKMTFSRQISSLLSTSLSYYGTAYASMLADMYLTLDFQMAENSGKVIMGIGYGEKDLAAITMSVETGDGSGISVPDAKNTVFMENEEDLEGWLKSIDWESFIEKLDKANLPDEVIDLLEELSVLMNTGDASGLFGYYDGLYYGDDYFGDDYYGDDYYGDSYYPDEYYGDVPGSDSDGGLGSDYNDDTYGDSLWGDENALEQLLQSEDWQEELEGWNAGVTDMGITITTEADGNTLVFSWHLPDDDFFGSLNEEQCAQMGDIFLETLSSADFLLVFETGYGIRLDGVRTVFLRSDGTEIYRDEIN